MASNNPHDAGPKGAAELITARGIIVVGLVVAASLLSIGFLDAPLYEFIALHFGHYAIHRFALRSGAILAAGIAIAVLAVSHKPQMAQLRRVLIITVYSAIAAIGTNDFIWKAIFARPTPYAPYNSNQAIVFFHAIDSMNSSFPSGHCALATATVTVLWHYYPRWWPLYLFCVAATSFMLLAGEWHYLSDLIAGALWGWICALVSLTLLAPIVREA